MEKNNNKNTKAFPICVYIELISAIIFSLFTFGYHADISLAALPVAVLYTAITVYFYFFKCGSIGVFYFHSFDIEIRNIIIKWIYARCFHDENTIFFFSFPCATY